MVKIASRPTRPGQLRAATSVLALALLSIALTSAVPTLSPLELGYDALVLSANHPQPPPYQQQAQRLQPQERRTLKHRRLSLVKRAPPVSSVPSVAAAGPPDTPSPVSPPSSPPTGNQASLTTNPPPATTTDSPPPPATTTVPSTVPPTTKPAPPVTTTEPTRPPETTTQPAQPTETTDAPSSVASPTSNAGHSAHSPTGRPSGPNNPGSTASQLPSGATVPTGAPTNGTGTNPTVKSSGPPVLPIVLGTILGLGALMGAVVFFFFRFRKNRRFDSKRPLSFLALSLDDPSLSSTNHESASARAGSGMEGELYDVNRPITSQPSLRYTPPVMSGLFGAGVTGGHSNRFSYQSSSEYSGATGAQFAQWSQDDENASLVGGRSQPVDFADDVNPAGERPLSDQSFVASSMVPMIALNSQRHLEHAGYNRPTAVDNDEVIVPRQPQGIPSSASSSPVLARVTTPVIRSGIPHLLDHDDDEPANGAAAAASSSSPVVNHAIPERSGAGSLTRSRPVSVRSARNQGSIRSNRSLATGNIAPSSGHVALDPETARRPGQDADNAGQGSRESEELQFL